MTYGETDDGNQLIIPFPKIWTGGHTWIRKGLWFMSYLDSFKTFIENPRSLSGNKYVKTECFSLGRRTAIEILCWGTFIFVGGWAFVALEVSTLQSWAIGSRFLIKAHWVILLRSANSYWGWSAGSCTLALPVLGQLGGAYHLWGWKSWQGPGAARPETKKVVKTMGSPSGMRETSYVWDLGKARGKFMWGPDPDWSPPFQ